MRAYVAHLCRYAFRRLHHWLYYPADHLLWPESGNHYYSSRLCLWHRRGIQHCLHLNFLPHHLNLCPSCVFACSRVSGQWVKRSKALQKYSSELTTGSMLLLRFTRVFSNMSLAISDLDGPSNEVCFLGGLRIPFIMCESMLSRPFGQHCWHCSSVAGFPRFRGKLWSKNELFSFQRSKNYLEISFSCLEKLCKRLQIFHVKCFIWFGLNKNWVVFTIFQHKILFSKSQGCIL